MRDRTTTFVTLVFLFCMGMTLYYYLNDNTHQMIFYGVLSLVNSSSLTDLRQSSQKLSATCGQPQLMCEQYVGELSKELSACEECVKGNVG